MKKADFYITIKPENESEEIERKSVYISNAYDVYSKFLDSFEGEDPLEELNCISEVVIQEGELLGSFKIGSRIDLEYLSLDDVIYKYIITASYDSLHYLLIGYFERPAEYEPPTEIPICCDLYDISRKNSYEAFLNYAKINSLPVNKGTNQPFFNDLEESLFDPHPRMYHRDPIFCFYFVENINRPGQYFHFVISSNTLFISEYTVPQKPYPYMFFSGSDIDLLTAEDIKEIYGD